MRILFLSLVTVLWFAGIGQQPQPVFRIDTSAESKSYWNKWINDQFEMGVEQKNDSIFIHNEVIKIIKDSVYRKSVYPEKYDWPEALKLVKEMDLKKGFWHLINIYMADTTTRSLVIGSLILYDSVMEIDKMLINAFYTYALTDPRVCRIINNKPDIYRPDLLDKYLYVTKVMINYIYAYRKERSGKMIPKSNE